MLYGSGKRRSRTPFLQQLAEFRRRENAVVEAVVVGKANVPRALAGEYGAVAHGLAHCNAACVRLNRSSAQTLYSSRTTIEQRSSKPTAPRFPFPRISRMNSTLASSLFTIPPRSSTKTDLSPSPSNATPKSAFSFSTSACKSRTFSGLDGSARWLGKVPSKSQCNATTVAPSFFKSLTPTSPATAFAPSTTTFNPSTLSSFEQANRKYSSTTVFSCSAPQASRGFSANSPDSKIVFTSANCAEDKGHIPESIFMPLYFGGLWEAVTTAAPSVCKAKAPK